MDVWGFLEIGSRIQVGLGEEDTRNIGKASFHRMSAIPGVVHGGPGCLPVLRVAERAPSLISQDSYPAEVLEFDDSVR
jgi:hypothetical protein